MCIVWTHPWLNYMYLFYATCMPLPIFWSISAHVCEAYMYMCMCVFPLYLGFSAYLIEQEGENCRTVLSHQWLLLSFSQTNCSEWIIRQLTTNTMSNINRRSLLCFCWTHFIPSILEWWFVSQNCKQLIHKTFLCTIITVAGMLYLLLKLFLLN